MNFSHFAAEYRKSHENPKEKKLFYCESEARIRGKTLKAAEGRLKKCFFVFVASE
jgi:hypothetical protein